MPNRRVPRTSECFTLVFPAEQPCAYRESGARSFQYAENLQGGQVEQTTLVPFRSAVKIAIFQRLRCVQTALFYCQEPSSQPGIGSSPLIEQMLEAMGYHCQMVMPPGASFPRHPMSARS